MNGVDGSALVRGHTLNPPKKYLKGGKILVDIKCEFSWTKWTILGKFSWTFFG